MKKVIGLFLVILISTVSVFAQKERHGKKGGDPAQRCEKMITSLNLNEKQAADFRKVETAFRTKMMKEREEVKADRQKKQVKMKAMRDDKNAEMKKILTDEQYKQYIEKQQSHTSGKGKGKCNGCK